MILPQKGSQKPCFLPPPPPPPRPPQSQPLSSGLVPTCHGHQWSVTPERMLVSVHLLPNHSFAKPSPRFPHTVLLSGWVLPQGSLSPPARASRGPSIRLGDARQVVPTKHRHRARLFSAGTPRLGYLRWSRSWRLQVRPGGATGRAGLPCLKAPALASSGGGQVRWALPGWWEAGQEPHHY